MPSETVIALRKQLREKFPAAHRSCGGPPQAVAAAARSSIPAFQGPNLPSSPSSDAPSPAPSTTPRREVTHPPTVLPPIARRATESHSELLTRNFAKGAITEISPAAPSCGLSLIVAALLAEEEQSETATPSLPLVLIDARDRFDPASFTPEECARLLWLRCHDTTQALRAADLLLRDGNLPVVLLDLSALPARELRRIPTSSWHRLRQLAETTDTSLLALTPSPLIPRTALRLTLSRPFTLDDLQLSRPELLTTLRTQATRHLHRTA